MKRKLVIFLLCCSVFFAKDAEIFFSCDVDIGKKYCEWIEKEPRIIRLALYRLSHVKSISLLASALQRGVTVEVIVDSASICRNTPLMRIVEAGGWVGVWNGGKQNRMKHNFCLFGSSHVAMGSYSFYANKWGKHVDSLLWIENEQIFKDCDQEFQRMKKEGSITLLEYLQHNAKI